MVPRVALPHQPANGVPVTEVLGRTHRLGLSWHLHRGSGPRFQGRSPGAGCRRGNRAGVTVVVTPPTPRVREALEEDGTLERLAAHGAVITETGCGPCCGTTGPIPHPNAQIISTANRNFQARMGQATAAIHLASPATCAAAATAGRIVDPREVA